MPEIDDEFKWLPLPTFSIPEDVAEFKAWVERQYPWIKDYWADTSGVNSVVAGKEQPMTATFKVGDRVRFKQAWIDGQGNTPPKCIGKTGTVYKVDNEWVYVTPDNEGEIAEGGWSAGRLELISSKPQFKKGDKLRLLGGVNSRGAVVPNSGPWYLVLEENGTLYVGEDREGGWSQHAHHSAFELWDKQEKPMTATQARSADSITKSNKLYARTPTAEDPLGQRASKPVNCAICNKEYTATNDVGDIIGGCVLDGPVKADANQSEEMVIGPCCYPRIMDTIMDLKTNRKPDTDRQNATNSWMPHDEEGNL